MNEFRIQVGRNWYTFNIGEWWTKHTVLTEMVPAAVNVFLDKVEQALEENEDVGEVVRVIHDAICTHTCSSVTALFHTDVIFKLFFLTTCCAQQRATTGQKRVHMATLL